MVKFLLWNIFGAALLFAAHVNGLVGPLLDADQTHLTKAIGVLFLAGVVLCGVKLATVRRAEYGGDPDSAAALASADIALVRVIANTLLRLGLIGTVLGFIIAASAIDPSAAGSVDTVGPLVTGLLAGMGTALPTTLVGAIGNAWLLVCYHILMGEATKRYAACIS